MYSQNYEGRTPEFRVLIKSKGQFKPIKVYNDTEGRNWVEARDGTEFGLEFYNPTNQNLLVISSVDGLNIITGKRASIESHNGYIVEPFKKLFIEGWRISQEKIKAFQFTKNKKDSYAAKATGDDSNVGVIGVAFFKKIIYNYNAYATNWVGNPKGTRNTDGKVYKNQSFGFSKTISTTSLEPMAMFNCSATMDSFEMGTAMGKEKESAITYCYDSFETVPYYDFTIYYDSKENLIANGIMKPEKKLPEPFQNTGFCKEV